MSKSSFKKGDIVVCSRTDYSGHFYSNLEVGEKYEVLDQIDLSANLDVWGTGLFLKNIKTGDVYKFFPFPSSLFISLEVFREFKLRDILK